MNPIAFPVEEAGKGRSLVACGTHTRLFALPDRGGWSDEMSGSGAFVGRRSEFREWVSADGSRAFPPSRAVFTCSSRWPVPGRTGRSSCAC